MTTIPTWHGLRRFAHHLARACRFVWQAAPALTAVSAALAVAQSLLPLVALYLLKLIVDTITAAISGTGDATGHSVVMLIAVAAAVALLGVLTNSLAAIAGDWHSQIVADRVHDILHAKSIEVDLEYYDQSQYYDTLHRAQQEAPYRPARIARGLMSLCQSALSLGAMAGLLISFHWASTVVLILAVAPEAFVYLKYANAMYAWRRSRTSTERHAQYYDWMMTAAEHAQELRLFDLGRFFMRQFRDLRDRLRREKMTIVTRRSLIQFGAQSVATAVVFGAYAFIAIRTVAGAITLGDLVMYFGALQRGQEYLRQLLHAVAALYEDNLFLTSLYEFLDVPRRVPEPARPKAVPRPLRKGIVFEGVSFDYGTRQALVDVDLVIPAGSTVALVGHNGSGKTTLVKLIARLYDPRAGRITLDGVDLRDFDTAKLRREMSIIFQDYARYHLTARHNIWFGNVKCPPYDARIVAAARRAGIDDLIHALPNGFDTVLGKGFDDGEELSVGEWQKVALARALMRDAQILVLDEPTSAMDADAEYEMFKRFREVTTGRTAILISHRLSTVKVADLIYVLRAGRVVERGTHDELLRNDGVYAGLFAAQANAYH